MLYIFACSHHWRSFDNYCIYELYHTLTQLINGISRFRYMYIHVFVRHPAVSPAPDSPTSSSIIPRNCNDFRLFYLCYVPVGSRPCRLVHRPSSYYIQQSVSRQPSLPYVRLRTCPVDARPFSQSKLTLYSSRSSSLRRL